MNGFNDCTLYCNVVNKRIRNADAVNPWLQNLQICRDRHTAGRKFLSYILLCNTDRTRMFTLDTSVTFIGGSNKSLQGRAAAGGTLTESLWRQRTKARKASASSVKYPGWLSFCGKRFFLEQNCQTVIPFITRQIGPRYRKRFIGSILT